jgi:hypothetical protein
MCGLIPSASWPGFVTKDRLDFLDVGPSNPD